jgi:hypothetical protein
MPTPSAIMWAGSQLSFLPWFHAMCWVGQWWSKSTMAAAVDLDAFFAADLRLVKLTDVPALAGAHRPDACLPAGGRFPRFMLLAFTKPA